MNLDELRTVQSTERTKDSLQNLRPSFYQDVGEYIAELETERDRLAEELDDPFASPEIRQLTDEIETAKDVVEAIYERRMGKLVKQASLAAAGMNAADDGLTAEEQDLFDDLVARIESNKGRVLDVLEGKRPSDTPSDAGEEPPAVDPGEEPPAADPDDGPPIPPEAPPAERGDPDTASDGETDPVEGVSAAEVMGEESAVDASSTSTSTSTSPSEPASPPPAADPAATDGEGPTSPADDPTPPAGPATEPGAEPSPEDEVNASESGTPDDTPGDDVDRVTVRITRDVGSILGVDDREYTLASDDVVTLPERNATPLVERDAAEPLE